jgi:hypothetical protein
MKTETHYIYWTFSEHTSSGVSYSVHDEELHRMIQDSMERDDDSVWSDRTLCGEVEIEPASREVIAKMGCEALDLKNATLRAEIMKNNEKKQQLMAIEFQS